MKYFVISDIHGFYKQMMIALSSSGFRKNNPEHTLIVLGDIFDRGPDSVKVYKYLRSIPSKRRILIRGNHEYLLRDAVQRGYFYSNDYSNGTAWTVEQFTKDIFLSPAVDCQRFKDLGIIEWFDSDEWVNYYELGNFIFVHSWIPVTVEDDLPMYIVDHRKFSFNKNWRNASAQEWEDATWGCPWKNFKAGLVPEGKTIVCGHWHVSDFHKMLEHDPLGLDNYHLFFSEQLIGLDACTAWSGFCNVLVIEDGKCYDQDQKELTYCVCDK